METQLLDNKNHVVIHVSGIDLIHGTPVIDIKPYHPADRVEEARAPRWIAESFGKEITVEFEESVLLEIEEAVKNGLEFYDRAEDVVCVLREALAQDPRTLHSKQKHGSDGSCYGLALDLLDVTFQVVSESTFKVIAVKYWKRDQQHLRTKMRSEAWLKETLAGVRDAKSPS